MNKTKVLFVCVHNSARSQMSEAFLKKLGEDKFEVESAGLEPGKLNPLAIEAMKEKGVDISQNKTQSVFDLYKQNKTYDCIITVCDESQSAKCPVFLGSSEKLHWSFQDPSTFMGTWKEKMRQTRKIRDQIENMIKEWLETKQV